MFPIDNFFRAASLWPHRAAVEIDGPDGRRAISYKALATMARAVGAGMQAIDPTPQSRVGICGYNSFEHLLGWLGCFAAGKVWVPLNPRNGCDELDRIIDLTQPSIIVFDADCGEKFSATTAHLICGKGTDPSADHQMQDIITNFDGAAPQTHDLSLDDLQAIKFTSGSSGMPKGVMQSYRVWNSCIASMLVSFQFDQADRHLIAAPMTHGANTLILPVFTVGGTQLFAHDSGPSTIIKAIEDLQASIVYVPPTMVYMMLADKALATADMSSLRHFVIGGAAIRPDMVAVAMPKFNYALETCFGQTEVPQIAICMRAAEWQDPQNYASTGRATMLTKIGIMDAGGNFLGTDEMGEIVLAGDLVMKGYYKMPDKTAETIVDGWLHTGDIGYIDARGYVFIKDRIRDVVVTGGFNVYPSDVEAVLGQHPDVRECVVFGVADDKWGEAVHAAVELHEGAVGDAAALIGYVKQHLDSVKAPKAVHIADALPRSAVGKVLRREAKRQFTAN
jgi:fatty-acyl-CoA synthase